MDLKNRLSVEQNKSDRLNQSLLRMHDSVGPDEVKSSDHNLRLNEDLRVIGQVGINTCNQKKNTNNNMMAYCSPHPGYSASVTSHFDSQQCQPFQEKKDKVNVEENDESENVDDEEVTEKSEGNIHKKVLFSMGSMAKLKHPRRFWPRDTNICSSTSALDGFERAKHLEFSRSATLTSLI